MTKEQMCIMLNCTMQQLNKQFKSNAEILNGMKNKAKNKKVNGYSKNQLTILTNNFKKLSK